MESSHIQRDRVQDTLSRFVPFIATHLRHDILLLKQPQLSKGPVTSRAHANCHNIKAVAVMAIGTSTICDQTYGKQCSDDPEESLRPKVHDLAKADQQGSYILGVSNDAKKTWGRTAH